MSLYRTQTFIVTVTVNEDESTGDELTETARSIEHALRGLPLSIVRISVELGPDVMTVGDET